MLQPEEELHGQQGGHMDVRHWRAGKAHTETPSGCLHYLHSLAAGGIEIYVPMDDGHCPLMDLLEQAVREQLIPAFLGIDTTNFTHKFCELLACAQSGLEAWVLETQWRQHRCIMTHLLA